MQIAGYIASLMIGLSLGMIGGGGSILTVPVLVYLFGISPMLATSYSLVIVGVVSLMGFINHYRRKLVDIHAGMLFGVTSVVTVLLTRHFLIPHLPEILFYIKSRPVPTGMFMMILFALLMIAAAIAMLTGNKKAHQQTELKHTSFKKLLFYGGLVGFITGLLGAGGGFLLIPALMLFAKLSLKRAAGTSLMIITFNSATGILADPSIQSFNWFFLAGIVVMALAGLAIGLMMSKRIGAQQLKTAFGIVVLVLGLSVLITELIKL